MSLKKDWGKLYLPEKAKIDKSENDKGVSFIMPESSIYKGYLVFVPKSLYKQNINAEGKIYYTILCPLGNDKNFKFILQNRAGHQIELLPEELYKIQLNKQQNTKKQNSKNLIELSVPLKVWQANENSYRTEVNEKQEWISKKECFTEKIENDLFVTKLSKEIVETLGIKNNIKKYVPKNTFKVR